MGDGGGMATQDTPDTKQRILDAAERLFADRGLAATSLRAITADADANLGAVNYHFGSKDRLVEAVVERRLAPINAERLRLLDALEADAGGDGVPVEALVEAFVAPALRSATEWSDAQSVMRMIAHVMSQADATVRRMFVEQFREVLARFAGAFRRSRPELSETEVLWRLMFGAGAMVHTMAMAQDAILFTEGRVDPTDPVESVRHLVPFVTAGMNAPATERR